MKRLIITAAVSLVVGLVGGLILGRQIPPSREQVANYLSNISVGEFSEFTKRNGGSRPFPSAFSLAAPPSPASRSTSPGQAARPSWRP
jgi:hypothetical protein